MKRILLLALFVYSVPGSVLAQETEGAWEKSALGGLNMTQTSFDNWASGGENAFAWQVNFNYKFVKNTDKVEWSNSGKFAYGGTKSGDLEMRKSTDEIKLESVVTYKLGATVNPFVAVTGETQFGAGYDYSTDSSFQISAFMDPGYFRESLGAGMKINESLGTRLGLSMKQTVTSDYPAPYADDVETLEIETVRSEFGIESVTDLAMQLTETTTFNSKLELFSAFEGLEDTDVKFDNTLLVKISDNVNMNFNLMLIYDSNISTKRQIKQAMAFGLNYTFI